ncbi:uncharacterized protein EKO05_0008475 [Ascochyta rabiei]|uniref:uncharacterized protein n=1 Tax=Didymella rabiei TaxID=5454 RepID=UPI0021FAAE1C|nr:uncharacterized protein EKO05_0008475 [Ascochyta rabiei]UPX18167.1 hypothetical protein EKO05_0008475 [Ascochyta rabiei]
MKAALFIISFAATSWAADTCAHAPEPQSDKPYDEVMFKNNGIRYEASCGKDLRINYAPPHPGTKSGVLTVVSENQGFKSIIRLNGPIRGTDNLQAPNSAFWANSNTDCRTNFEAFTPISVTCYKA